MLQTGNSGQFWLAGLHPFLFCIFPNRNFTQNKNKYHFRSWNFLGFYFSIQYLSQLLQCGEGSMLNPVIDNRESSPKWRLLPPSSLQTSKWLSRWEGLPWRHYGHPGATPTNRAWQAPPDQLWEGRKTAWGLAWSGQGQPLPSEIREDTCLLLPALLPYPLIHGHPSWPFHAPTSDSFQIQWVKLHWKQTITPTVKGRKQCLIAVLCQCQHINPSQQDSSK